MPTRKSLQFSPSNLLKHLWTGPVRAPHHILTTQTEPRGFVKSPMQNKVVYMELSLRLSSYLRHSLRGYTVGTTMDSQSKAWRL
jgi:hypothetical protein